MADEITTGPAPDTVFDPSRTTTVAGPQNFAGYPKTLYHPVIGAREVKDPNEDAGLPDKRRNWFDTPEEADAHRTLTESDQVIHANRRVKVDALLSDKDPDLAAPEVRGEAGVVRNSVSATESLKSGFSEPL